MQIENPGQIYIDHRLPVFWVIFPNLHGGAGNTGVTDHDVRWSDRGLACLKCLLHGIQVCNIDLDGNSAIAKLGCGTLGQIQIDVPKCHFGARLDNAVSNGISYSLGTAGYRRRLSLEINLVQFIPPIVDSRCLPLLL